MSDMHAICQTRVDAGHYLDEILTVSRNEILSVSKSFLNIDKANLNRLIWD